MKRIKVDNKNIWKAVLFILILCMVAIIWFIISSYFSGKQKLEETSDGSYQLISYQGKEYAYKEHLINLLCLGIDKDEVLAERNDVDNSVGQSDAIVLVSIDLEENAIRMIEIPRDTMVELIMYNGNGDFIGTRNGQLTLQYAYADGQEHSAQLVTKQVTRLLGGIPVTGYAAINFSCVPVINDAVGGVDITMEQDYTLFHPAFIKGETVHLEGEMALSFIRERNINEFGSAYERIGRQKQYIQEFVKQAKAALKKDYMLPVTLIQELQNYMITDIETDEMIYLATNIIDCTFSEDNMYILPGEIIRGEKHEEYYLEEDKVQEILIEIFYEPVAK